MVSTARNTDLVFTAANETLISVSDQNASDLLNMVLSITDGTGKITVSTGGGATISDNGSISVIIEGTEAQLNAALATVTYSPTIDASGSPYTTLTISTTDGGGNSRSREIEIEVTP